MKRILFTLALILSLTACSKPETPQPEPEPESYIGYLRSEHPNIKIPGVSVNDRIIYNLKSAISMSGPGITGVWTSIYSGNFTYWDVLSYDIPPIVEIYVIPEESWFCIYLKNTLYGNEIKYEIIDGKESYKTDNIKSVNIKEAEVILDSENLKKDICRFDIEITIPDYVIEIVYYGNSHHQEIYPPVPHTKL